MKPRLINDRYQLIVPDHVADWDAPSSWERVRFASMEAGLHPEMRLFDVGAEHGWISAIYASFVGASNMVLIEPSPEFWPNIRLIWEHNGLDAPHACVQALLGTRHAGGVVLLDGWPPAAEGDVEAPAQAYRYLHEPGHLATTPVTAIDHITSIAGAPDAITIDVEGAGLQVLRGAVNTLQEHRPLVWISIHPDLMARDYGTEPAELFDFMTGRGYEREYLGTDHEEHHLFTHRDGVR